MILFLLSLSVGLSRADLDKKPEVEEKSWLHGLSANDFNKVGPYLFFGMCDFSKTEALEKDLQYSSLIKASRMVLNAFATIGKYKTDAEMKSEMDMLQFANDANCRLLEKWSELLGKNGKTTFETWQSEYQKLYEEYLLRVNGLVPLGLLTKNHAALVPTPLNHTAIMAKLRDTRAEILKRQKKK